MITVGFILDKDDFLRGFDIKGHANSSCYGTDIVCAAVSSATFMVVNTITEVMKVKPSDITAGEGEMLCILNREDAKVCKSLLEGLELHIKAIVKQYPKNVQIEFKEAGIC